MEVVFGLYCGPTHCAKARSVYGWWPVRTQVFFFLSLKSLYSDMARTLLLLAGLYCIGLPLVRLPSSLPTLVQTACSVMATSLCVDHPMLLSPFTQ